MKRHTFTIEDFMPQPQKFIVNGLTKQGFQITPHTAGDNSEIFEVIGPRADICADASDSLTADELQEAVAMMAKQMPSVLTSMMIDAVAELVGRRTDHA